MKTEAKLYDLQVSNDCRSNVFGAFNVERKRLKREFEVNATFYYRFDTQTQIIRYGDFEWAFVAHVEIFICEHLCYS